MVMCYLRPVTKEEGSPLLQSLLSSANSMCWTVQQKTDYQRTHPNGFSCTVPTPQWGCPLESVFQKKKSLSKSPATPIPISRNQEMMQTPMMKGSPKSATDLVPEKVSLKARLAALSPSNSASKTDENVTFLKVVSAPPRHKASPTETWWRNTVRKPTLLAFDEKFLQPLDSPLFSLQAGTST